MATFSQFQVILRQVVANPSTASLAVMISALALCSPIASGCSYIRILCATPREASHPSARAESYYCGRREVHLEAYMSSSLPYVDASPRYLPWKRTTPCLGALGVIDDLLRESPASICEVSLCHCSCALATDEDWSRPSYPRTILR